MTIRTPTVMTAVARPPAPAMPEKRRVLQHFDSSSMPSRRINSTSNVISKDSLNDKTSSDCISNTVKSNIARSASADESSMVGDSDKRPKRQRKPDISFNQPKVSTNSDVYKNFGNEFVVAATDKKIRFYPKKEPKESIEDIKNKERLER